MSVLILSARRPHQLGECLRSLREQADCPSVEVLVCGLEDDSLAPLVRSWVPDAKVGVVRGANLGAARNPMIQRATGELLLFLDDDVVLDRAMLAALDRLARENPEIAVFGGPNESSPTSSFFQAVEGSVLASLVGSGPVRRRYGRHPASLADERYFTLCNLAIRRKDMLPFDPELTGAEENEVLGRLSQSGLTMLYHPDIVAFHDRRPDLRSFWAQMVKYGRGRGQLMLRSPSTFRPAYVVPPLLVSFLAFVPVLALWLRPALWLLGLYGLCVLAGASKVGFSLRRPAAFPLSIVLILTVHLGYGWGVIRGLISRSAASRKGDPSWVDLPVMAEPVDRQAISDQ